MSQALHAIVKKLHMEADKLNRLDAVLGDGDTGTAFSRAADAIARDLVNGKLSLDRPSSLFRRLGLIAESRMGGTCGASRNRSETYLRYKLKNLFFFSLWIIFRCCC